MQTAISSRQTPSHRKPLKRKRCIHCGDLYGPRSSFQKVCSPGCAIATTKQPEYRQTLSEAAERARRAEIREYRKRTKTKAQWLREAQRAFNTYVRIRDHYQPCISCQRHHTGQYHAGHYRTTKAAPQIRFHPLNNHKQCQPCNTHLSGNITEYRTQLIHKIGIDKVEQLEHNNQSRSYTIEELKRIKAVYTKKAKLYRKFRNLD